MKPNGPAIKLENVPEYSGRRGFCSQGTEPVELYECRGTHNLRIDNCPGAECLLRY